MNRTKVLSLIFLLIFSISYSQDDKLSRHSVVNEFVAELIAAKIDTICDYEIFDEKSEAMYTQYIFWKTNGKTKLKKIEFEKNYPIIDVEIDDIWSFLISNSSTIKQEFVESFGYKEGNKVIDVISESGDAKEFNLYLTGTIIKFWTSAFDFQKTAKIDRKNLTNANYEHNQNLKGKTVIDMFDNLTKQLEKKRAFN